MEAGIDHVPRVTIPSVVEPIEPIMEPILTPQQPEVPRVSTANKGNRTYIPSPKKNIVPSTKTKGIVIGVPTAFTPFLSEEEVPILRGEDIIPTLVDVPVEELNEEKTAGSYP